MTSTYDQLQEPFDERALRSRNKGGANLTYVPIAEVIARLNTVLGVENWNVLASDAWRDDIDPNWVIAKVTLEAIVDGTKTVKIGWGGQEIKNKKAGGPLDLGDEFKGAASDALKKAATMLGIALDLARDEDALIAEDEAIQRRSLEDAPKADDDTIRVISEFATGLEDEALDEFKAWWKDNVGVKLNSGLVTVEQADRTIAQFGI